MLVNRYTLFVPAKLRRIFKKDLYYSVKYLDYYCILHFFSGFLVNFRSKRVFFLFFGFFATKTERLEESQRVKRGKVMGYALKVIFRNKSFRQMTIHNKSPY